MSGRIDEGEVRRVAELARLRLEDGEVSLWAEQLGAILEYMEKLKELDVSGVEPTAHPLPVRNVFGDDDPVAPYGAERALSNAPSVREGFFAVPKVLGLEGGA